MSNKQNLKKLLSGLSLSFLVLSATSTAKAETLDEALSYTYVANPTILSQRAYLRSIYEKITQSQAGYKPIVSGSASYGYKHSRTRYQPIFSKDESMPVSLGISAVQPVFSGFGTVANVKAAQENFKAEVANLRNIEQTALNDAVVAYTGVIRSLAVLRLNENNESVLKRQLEYTQDRFRVGELTKTDVAQSEARYAGAVAQRIEAQGDVKIAYASYQEVVGKMPEKIFEPEVPSAKIPQTLEEVLEIALKSNPIVQAAEMHEKSAQSSVKEAESDFYPSVDFEASYAMTRAGAHGSSDFGQGTVETGRLRSQDTALLLVMDVPFYQAGSVSSRVRESKYVAGQAKINVNTAKREVIRLTTQAWENYQSVQASLTSLEEQVSASLLALEGVRYEEEAGTRTILDVLNAEQELLDARVEVVTAKKNLVDASYQLLVAMGKMSPVELGLDISRYRKADAQKENQPS